MFTLYRETVTTFGTTVNSAMQISMGATKKVEKFWRCTTPLF